MTKISCRWCSRILGQTDGEKICFPLIGNLVCVWIRGEYEKLLCVCGQTVKVEKLLLNKRK